MRNIKLALGVIMLFGTLLGALSIIYGIIKALVFLGLLLVFVVLILVSVELITNNL